MRASTAIIVLCAALLTGAPATGQTQEAAAPPAASDAPKPKRVLTPEELAEKESRKACKIELCATFRNKLADRPDIACDIVKTWREEDITQMVSGGAFEWPWGKAKCETKLALTRAPLVKAVSEARYELSVPKHTVVCELDRKSEGKVYRVSVAMTPKVTFENGKAVEGALNWGDVDAPLLAYGVLWPATGLDNKTNMLGGQLVKMVNEFLTSKCDEVKDALPGASKAP